MGLSRVKFGKRQHCNTIWNMTLSGVTVTEVDCTTYFPEMTMPPTAVTKPETI